MGVGQYVTIFQGRYYDVADTSPENMFFSSGRQHGEEDKHYNGMILRIIAIDFPYVAIVDLIGNTGHFDLREGWLFKALSKAYVTDYTKFIANKDKGEWRTIK